MTAETPPGLGPGILDRQASSGAGMASLVVAATMFSWGFIIVKSVDLPAATLSFWRLLIGVVVLAAAAVVLRVPWPRQWRPLVGAGVAFGIHQLLFIAATQLTSVVIVTLLMGMQPLLVAVLSHRTVGERVSRWFHVFALLGVVGLGIVLQANFHAPSRSWQGDVLALLNVGGFTGYFLFAKRARSAGAPTLTFTAAVLFIAMIVVAPGMVWARAPMPARGDAALLALLALGPGNGHLLVNWAHRRVSAAVSSLILVIVPVLSTIWAHLIFGEPLGWRHALGLVLVAVAVEGGRRAQQRIL